MEQSFWRCQTNCTYVSRSKLAHIRRQRGHLLRLMEYLPSVQDQNQTRQVLLELDEKRIKELDDDEKWRETTLRQRPSSGSGHL